MYKIYADDTLIYDSTLEDYKIVKGVGVLETDKAGSFEFAVYPDHFYYHAFVEMKTIITVYKAGRIKFRGRVLTAVTDYWNCKTLTCEGELCFLQDTIVRPYSFKSTSAAAFSKFITDHNAQVDADKQFKVGTVTVTDLNSSTTYANVDYASTMSNITGQLLDFGGGHLLITHGDDGQDPIPTIHYLADFPTVASQPIEFGVNLRDYTKTIGAADIATALIPLGAIVDDENDKTEDPKLTIAEVNGGKDYVYNAEAVAKYGWIFKTMEWDDVTDAATLKSLAEAYLATGVTPNLTVELTAIDLHLLDRTIESYNVSEYVKINSKPHNFHATLLCNREGFDVLQPANDSVTLGYKYTTFTEASNKVLSKVVQGVTNVSSSLANSAVIVHIISRLDALEGVTVVITVSDSAGELESLLETAGTLLVAGRVVTADNTSLVVTGGTAEVRYTLGIKLAKARNVTVNGTKLGSVYAAGDTVSTGVSVSAGSVINIAFTS